jgi:hypothetical protein
MLPQNRRLLVAIRLGCLLVLVLPMWAACRPAAKEETATRQAAPVASAALTGKALAARHCGGCHLVPEPALLDGESWQQVLPRMGNQLGIYADDSSRAVCREVAALVGEHSGRDVYPGQPALSAADWDRLTKYYLQNAPARPLPPDPPPVPRKGLALFKVVDPGFRRSPPGTSLLRIDPAGQKIYLGDIHTRSLYAFDRRGRLLETEPVGEGPSDLRVGPQELRITVMESFAPTEHPSGAVLSIRNPGGEKAYGLLLDGLHRPVHAEWADLNADGREDVVVCEYGSHTGRLAWYEQRGDGYVRHVLRNLPGATRTQVHDFDGDGRPDILSLMAQGQEGFFLYYNQGAGRFREEMVMQFPPSYGSVYFELVDFDGNGHPDILYANGDNADFTQALKRYHGVRLLRNDGANRFEEAFFYPLPGAYKASANDFDGDGDLDIAAISFFPDFQNAPHTGFVYLENTGKMAFTARTFPQSVQGRWMVMDAGDLDGDGDTDLVLGSCLMETTPPGKPYEQQWLRTGSSFLILENTRRPPRRPPLSPP